VPVTVGIDRWGEKEKGDGSIFLKINPSPFFTFFNPKRWHLHLGPQPHFPTPSCKAMTIIAVNTAKDKTRGTILSALLASLSRASTVSVSNATIQELKNEKF
jgi:hypothetical protein